MQHTLSCENTTEDIQLGAVRVRGMSVCNGIARMHMDLEARGSPDALDVMHHFFNYHWLNDLDLPYLAALLDLRNLRCAPSACVRTAGRRWSRTSARCASAVPTATHPVR
ncbi:hypothetical protein I6G66_02460 [Delftia acidovorans]|uniref:Uncharacterized protein n=1 Tax=Delftia acidovorans TaxID=80866 RepID=A0A7T2S4T2_DELAC|nr:hypothetical protein [Delftia acidovorans]QPS08940.1 hypothetical protein I6G66_02460 [Delftia acidovorans]